MIYKLLVWNTIVLKQPQVSQRQRTVPKSQTSKLNRLLQVKRMAG